MARLSEATHASVQDVIGAAAPMAAMQAGLDEAAQVYTDALFATYQDTCLLVRIFMTAPYRSLPADMAAWVRALADSKGAGEHLAPETQVLALAGSTGSRPEWTGRKRSQGHVGIPLLNSDFVDDIPMMSRLLGSFGRDLSWMDTKDSGRLVRSMSKLSGRFFVPDAATTTDTRGRKVIADQDFVAAHGVRTVFGLANASAVPSGTLMTLIVFASEALTEGQVAAFQSPLTQLRRDVLSLVSSGKLFAA